MMLYVYEYFPVDEDGQEVADEFGQACRMRFGTRRRALEFAEAMRLRFPLFAVRKVPRCSRRFSHVG